jgi:phytoene/squalene synthetase
MKALFDQVAEHCSKVVTESYSTSFSLATRMLGHSIRKDIYNIYGFVRFADEIVDSFHDYDKEDLLNRFESDLDHALEHKISLNPILNAFQQTVHKHKISKELIDAFMKSMRWDLHKTEYLSAKEYKEYIYGSADVVGLMCLKVFVEGDQKLYESLTPSAMALGSAFQKVNFLRDLKADKDGLNRSYFPNLDVNQFDEDTKQNIIAEIEQDFADGLQGIFQLPSSAKFGVYTAYKYYLRLLVKLKKTPSLEIKSARVRVPNYQKMDVLARSFVRYQLNIL